MGQIRTKSPTRINFVPLLFNTFINDIFHNLSEGSVCNFADYYTIYKTNNADKLLNLINETQKMH